MIMTLLCLTLLAQDPGAVDRRPVSADAIVITMYSIADILGQPKSDTPGAEPAPIPKQTRDFVEGVLRSEMRPAFDPALDSIEIREDGNLLVRARADQQQSLNLLLRLNRSREYLVLGDATWIEGPKGAFQRMGIAAGPTPTVLESKDLERFRALGKDDPQFQVISSPRVVVYPLGESTMTVGEYIAYVKNWKLETVEPGEVKLPVPEIEHAYQGLELRARGILLGEQRVALELEASNSVVKRPIPTRTVELDPAITQVLTVATPEVEKKSIQARCTLGPGAQIAFTCPAAGKEQRELLVLVGAHAEKAASLQAAPADVLTITGAKKKPAPEQPKQPPK